MFPVESNSKEAKLYTQLCLQKHFPLMAVLPLSKITNSVVVDEHSENYAIFMEFFAT